MGESVMEVSVLKWLKQEGDTVKEGESVVQIATDKVDSDIIAPFSGVLKKILISSGSVARVGECIAHVNTEELVDSAFLVQNPIVDFKSSLSRNKQVLSDVNINENLRNNRVIAGLSYKRFYSPLVRNIARRAGLSEAELNSIPATAKENRVSKDDIALYLSHRIEASNLSDSEFANCTINTDDKVIELDRVRQLIAKRMVMSNQSVPHVTSFIEVDVTDIVNWRNTNKVSFEAEYGIKLTFTSIFIKAIAIVLEEYPQLNAYFLHNKFIQKHQINMGLAVALPDGNLIVPVIHNANKLSISEIAVAVADLSYRARCQKLELHETIGATYTISNIGTFGNLMGTPIIMQPQVAVMALGSILKKPAVVASTEGDTIAVRHLMFLSHSYDHRVIDGALGGGFVQRVAILLENFLEWV
jgi:2-oxoglutarate dehydrogenase E2 component (dihydrolipoamide succinyltransferase)